MFLSKSTILGAFIVFLQISSIIDGKPSSVQMPASCEGKTYCTEKSADYPQDVFDNILSDLSLAAIAEPETDTEHRQGEDNKSVCEPNEMGDSVIYEIVDEDGDVRFVAQCNKFMQQYKIIECMKPGRVEEANAVFTQDQVDSFNVTCVETRVSHKFLVLSHDKQNVEVATSKGGIPMGCSCRYSII